MSFSDEIIELIKKQLTPLEEDIVTLSEKINEIQLKEGPKGDTPTEKELLNLIKPLIPSPIKGEPGAPGKNIKGDPGDRGEAGISPGLDEIVKKVLNLIPTPKDGLRGEKGQDAPILEEIVKEVLSKLPKPRERSYGATPRLRDMWIDETPNGTVDGVNRVFTLSTNIIDNSEIVRIGGQVQEATTDYTLAGRTITFVVAPATNERVRVKFQKL